MNNNNGANAGQLVQARANGIPPEFAFPLGVTVVSKVSDVNFVNQSTPPYTEDEGLTLVSYLESAEATDDDRFEKTCLLRVSHYKYVPSPDYKQKQAQQEAGRKTTERIVWFYDVLGPRGNNMIALLIPTNNKGNKAFDHDIKLRDTSRMGKSNSILMELP